MSSLPAALLAASLAATAPAPTALDQFLALLGQQKCDEAFELVARVEVTSPPAAQSLKAAQAVATGAETCRAADPIVALSFSAVAKRLAPGDADVVTTHAEGLVAVQQCGEAASALDALIAVQPATKAPKARLLRARIARDEGDLADAVRLLTPLAADPAAKSQAEPLLAGTRGADRGPAGDEAPKAWLLRKAGREPPGGAARRARSLRCSALMAKAHNGFRAWRFLRASHYEEVIGLPAQKQRELLDQA